jgi:hypothetical protein
MEGPKSTYWNSYADFGGQEFSFAYSVVRWIFSVSGWVLMMLWRSSLARRLRGLCGIGFRFFGLFSLMLSYSFTAGSGLFLAEHLLALGWRVSEDAFRSNI